MMAKVLLLALGIVIGVALTVGIVIAIEKKAIEDER